MPPLFFRRLSSMALLLCVAFSTATRSASAVEFDIGDVAESGLSGAIFLSNASRDEEDTILFLQSLNNQTMLLTDTPTTIDGGVDKVVVLDASQTVFFLIRPADTVDPDAEFVLLHVASGQATLKDLNISTLGVDPDGDGEDLVGVFQIDAGAALAFDSDTECEGSECLTNARFVDADIRGDGGLVKLGQNTLILTGDNDYTGGSEIMEGELRGVPDALPGDFMIEEGARLVFDYRDTDMQATYSGSITGDGSLIKDGAGTLEIVDDVNVMDDGVAITGGTSILEGKLIATTELIDGDIAIASSGIFELHQEGAAGEYLENISGAGSLRKTGAENLLLSGANSFSGGLAIAEGMVTGDSASIPGDVLFEQSGTILRFEQTANGTHNGLISGPGRLVKGGSGTLTLAGISSYTEGTTVFDGTLRGDTASLISNIDLATSTAAVDFSFSGVQIFNGFVSGPGELVKSGTGTLALTSPQGYTGDTHVNGGVLRLDTDLSNDTDVFVGVDGELRNGLASGFMAGNLDVIGTLSPGGLTDVFEVGQDLSLTGGATLNIDLNEQGDASKVQALGTATIDDLVLGLDPTPGTYQNAMSYDAVGAGTINLIGAGVTGTTLDFAFLFVTNIRVDPAAVGEVLRFDLQADVSNIDQYAITPNQTATANAMEQLLASGTPDSLTILESFTILTVPEVPLVLDQLAGETLSAFTTGRITNAQIFNQMIARRFSATEYERSPPTGAPSMSQRLRLPGPGSLRASMTSPSAAGVSGGAADGVQRGGSIGAWLEPFVVFGHHRGRSNASDITSRLYGLSGGVDYRLPQRLPLPHSERIRIGLGMGYTRSSLLNDRDQLMSGRGNTVQTALYGGYRSDRLHVGLAGRYAWSGLDTTRRIEFQAIDRKATADFSGHEAGVFLEVGGHFGDPKRAWLHPLMSFQYDNLSQDSFRETGAGDLNLGVNGGRWESMLLTTGVRVSRLFTLRGEFGLEPEIRGGYIHEFGDTLRSVRSRFWAVPGATPFVTAGAPADESTGWVGTGYVMSVAEVPLLSLGYDAYIGENVTRHVLSCGVYLRW